MNMREIKFRAKNTINGNWVYGYYYQDKGHNFIHSGHTIYPVHPPTIGQYTGLQDKNGVDIYEGDMVQFSTRRYHLGKEKGLQTIKFKSMVEFEEGSFVISEGAAINGEPYNDTYLGAFANDPSSDFKSDSDIEVIGNIYQNPELL